MAEAFLPAPDEDYRIAYVLLSKRGPRDRQILEALARRPLSSPELERLVDGRPRHLAMALIRLRRDGLIDQRLQVRFAPPIPRYELTDLGIQVIFRMHEMWPAYVTLQMFQKGPPTGS